MVHIVRQTSHIWQLQPGLLSCDCGKCSSPFKSVYILAVAKSFFNPIDGSSCQWGFCCIHELKRKISVRLMKDVTLSTASSRSSLHALFHVKLTLCVDWRTVDQWAANRSHLHEQEKSSTVSGQLHKRCPSAVGFWGGTQPDPTPPAARCFSKPVDMSIHHRQAAGHPHCDMTYGI